jgi:CHAD domain-containing protein
MATSANETEIKYDLPAGAPLPSLTELDEVSSVREEAQEELEAQYFDTDDLRLLRAGVTLRRRVGGHDQGWHLKIPAALHTRREIQVPLGADETEVPAELAERILVYTRGKPVRPAAVIRTARQRLVLCGQSGDSLAELAVDDVHAHRSNGDPVPTGWREAELELTGGDTALLAEADGFLRRHGLRRSPHSAKFERAIGFAQPARPGRSSLSAASRAGDVVLAYLADQADRLKLLDPAVRGREPDAVHQMRIAARRLRSTLRSFAKVIWSPDRREVVAQVAADLKWLGGVLGEARDAEVLLAQLEGRMSELRPEEILGPVQARVRGHFAAAAAAAMTEVNQALNSDRYLSLLDRLDAMISAPELSARAGKAAKAVLPAAVRRDFRRTRRRMSRARRARPGMSRDTALHQARKAAKRARYSAEAVSPAIGQPASRFARKMKKVQSLLGDHQDAVISRQVERQLAVAAAQAGENAFTYGMLYQREVDDGREAQAKGLRAWEKGSRRKHRKWLRH